MCNLFDNLPIELQEIIINQKIKMETETFETFVEDFDVKLLSRKIIYSVWSSYIKIYVDRILVHYKPTNKYMIMTQQHSQFEDGHVPKYYIIETLLLNIHNYNKDYEFALQQHQDGIKWYNNITYQTYCRNNNIGEYTLEEFCNLRREINTFKKVIGCDRYNHILKFAS